MKKFSLVAIMACIVAAMFTSCNSNSPRGVAEDAMKCMQKGDYKGYLEYVYFAKNAEEKRAGFAQMIEEKAEKNPDAIAGNDIASYKFVSEEIDEEKGKAKVIFEVTYKDGNVKTESTDMICDETGKWWIDGKK